MTDDVKDLVAAFEDVLEAERGYLRTADFDGMSRLIVEKETLLKRLEGLDPKTEGLDRLRGGLERNAQLLAAAGQGIRQAGERLRGLSGKAGPLTTYDGQGRRSTVGDPEPSVSRSA